MVRPHQSDLNRIKRNNEERQEKERAREQVKAEEKKPELKMQIPWFAVGVAANRLREAQNQAVSERIARGRVSDEQTNKINMLEKALNKLKGG
jgi:hypothetical protein